MSSASDRRIHPGALTAIIVSVVLIAGAVVFAAWYLTSLASESDAAPEVDPTVANTQATDLLVQWQAAFTAYKDTNGSYPEMPDGGYCLGTGFPVGAGGTANCRDYTATSYYTEEASKPLMEALSSVGDLPTGGASMPVRGTVGPYALYEGSTINLLTAENGACVAPAVQVWTDGEGLDMCAITLDR
jgi:hypothetical protein